MPRTFQAGPDTYANAPHKTFLYMALPALFSLVAEPLTGLADTAFVARLGSEALAGLGIGTMVLSSTFWIFNFLGVGTQTRIANTVGSGHQGESGKVISASLFLALALGITTAIVIFWQLEPIITLMGGQGDVQAMGYNYMRYRLPGAPAILITFATFGALRGLQDMKAPLYIAAGINIGNILLDWLLIFGIGPFPAMGVEGAALATSISQWIGAIWSVMKVRSCLGLSWRIDMQHIIRLIRIGGDLFVRTGMVIIFLLLATRTANAAGATEGAAHQAIRQFYIFTALFLDAYAITGQSLIGYFFGAGDTAQSMRVAKTTCQWSLATGAILMLSMTGGQPFIEWLLVPEDAWKVFGPAWLIAALIQPVNALSFATDGIHWGTGDFRYLRNAMILSVAGGMLCLLAVEYASPAYPLAWVWAATSVWTTLRAATGLLRIWPGIKNAPLQLVTR